MQVYTPSGLMWKKKSTVYTHMIESAARSAEKRESLSLTAESRMRQALCCLSDQRSQPVQYSQTPACEDTVQDNRTCYSKNLTSDAEYLTFLFVFGGMLWRVIQRDIINVDTSSFLTFLVFNVLCLEFGLQKARVDRFFKR